jgi:hypothetical protein
MFHRWAALVLVLALWAMTPKTAAGQGNSKLPRGHGAGALGNAYPNPFNPEVRIPFTVGDPGCTDAGQLHEVSIQIKNVLAQLVAIPVLEGASSSVTSSAVSLSGGQTPVTRLRLGCGNYTAFWSGDVLGTKREAASGVYLVLFTVDGENAGSRRIFNRK